jgi:hypothetical protein
VAVRTRRAKLARNNNTVRKRAEALLAVGAVGGGGQLLAPLLGQPGLLIGGTASFEGLASLQGGLADRRECAELRDSCGALGGGATIDEDSGPAASGAAAGGAAGGGAVGVIHLAIVGALVVVVS